MKRFHVHVSVGDLQQSIAFYSSMFGAAPSVLKDDYAKWMLDDPALNFAISNRDGKPGLNHLGFQVDSADALSAMRQQAEAADIGLRAEPGAACCYARSDKHWIEDPQGIAWETFHTLGSIPVFGMQEATGQAGASACCAPPTVSVVMPAPARKGGCCG
jgi:catechol 2,3-dioxygenase-like lactoylglutathione lyase family enzyme